MHRMAAMLRDGGLLVLTSRNWELVRQRGAGLEIADDVERYLVTATPSEPVV